MVLKGDLNPRNMKIDTLHRALRCIHENPEICMQKVYMKTSISYDTLNKIKHILVPRGFMISFNSTRRENNYILSSKGKKLMFYLEGILKEGRIDN